MRYLTSRKQAEGLGSAKTGTHHHWQMQVKGMALVILIPLFIFTFGPMLGRPYAEVAAYYARPFPAIVAGLTFIVGLIHFKEGAQIMIEDYTDGNARKILILLSTFISYAAAAAGVYALIRLAL
ncbi:succinate dehydrogenase, hydrophobic membrane anchor protein [Haematobacter massiliensis]|uniref:Succinate dehydrogenase hydrophobic membrane anchor subunit n=1 Tax=Haematobacter massiliensis TaxID=195105 RepID=A0A086YAW0_9RHOB|nr:succinate dehydrogenase, hydrophobic membrane anchor protein [Haematobacter massiliensis]KFI31410.1 succinate dehydrogenase [Haematobacter massiliensis]OWJ71688.1 succinate dehydrogenase, hydrophobic membrane anchor protein [Haematobacter massiliensis]OWJ88125.1 succinate dehydrogenase, hydrophobic membrane anchor protein [Haematobacter massiliensis]QBJ23491.1 succinate dehydrogenase, hydrophobic membrane anchor protein [Haematobacter massiliensis]